MDPASRLRFTGFADLYDANRPAPPRVLGPLLAGYANVAEPVVADLGSGTGLSSRWAASWAGAVIGIEPNDEMRAVAERYGDERIRYHRALAERTGLDAGSVDIVLAVQALHWMEPASTLAEVARILRPGGVLAVVDADWPPVSGVAGAELAWAVLHRRIRALEARLARGEPPSEVHRPITSGDPDLADDDLSDPHRNRLMPGGVRSWSKSAHLHRMVSSGYFSFTREVVLSEPVEGGCERFKALMFTQGSYQGLRRAGLSDEEIGAREFERTVQVAFAAARAVPGLAFSWRIRLGITAARP